MTHFGRFKKEIPYKFTEHLVLDDLRIPTRKSFIVPKLINSLLIVTIYGEEYNFKALLSSKKALLTSKRAFLGK